MSSQSSIIKQRLELLKQLTEAFLPVDQRSDNNADALFRSCKDLVDFHTFLDTHPDVVAAEWAQLRDRIVDNAQFDKAAVLASLASRLLSSPHPHQIESTQRDFPSRQLSFLLAASRNVLGSAVDPSLLKLEQQQSDNGDEESTTNRPEDYQWSDDSDDSDDGWWTRSIAYSPDDALSAWSGAEEEGDDEKEEERNDNDNDALSNVSTQQNQQNQQQTVPISLLSVSPALQETVHRHPSYRPPLRSPTPRRTKAKQYYGPTSLTVWLASRHKEGGHPARHLDPRRCFTQPQLVVQILNMLKGVRAPGLAFRFDAECTAYTPSKGVHSQDLPSATLAALLPRFAMLATQLQQIQEFCEGVVGGGDGGNGRLPTVAAFASELMGHMVGIRAQVLRVEGEGVTSLLVLRSNVAMMERQVAVLHRLVVACLGGGGASTFRRERSMTPFETVAALLDAVHDELSGQLMHPTARGGSIAAMLTAIFQTVWRPLLRAIDDWVERGVLVSQDILPEFFIRPPSSAKQLSAQHRIATPLPLLIGPALAQQILQAGLATQSVEQGPQQTQSRGKYHSDTPGTITSGTTGPPTPTAKCVLYDQFQEELQRFFMSTTKATCTDDNQNDDEEEQKRKQEPTQPTTDTIDEELTKEWNQAVSRDKHHAFVPENEDIDDLQSLPSSALLLPAAVEMEAYMLPSSLGDDIGTAMKQSFASATTNFYGDDDALAHIAEDQQQDTLLPCPFFDIEKGHRHAWTSSTSTHVSVCALPLQVITRRCLLRPITQRIDRANAQACASCLSSGLLHHIEALCLFSTTSSVDLDPFIEGLLSRCSTPRGADGVSVVELNASLSDALHPAVDFQVGDSNININGLKPRMPLSVKIEKHPASALGPYSNNNDNNNTIIRSLERLVFVITPLDPLCHVVPAPAGHNDTTSSFLEVHSQLTTFSLQLRWTEASLVTARVAGWHWKSHSGARSRTPSTALHQSMLHIVRAVRGHVLSHALAAKEVLTGRLGECETLEGMRVCCEEYAEKLKVQCLFDGGSGSGTLSGVKAALMGGLDAALRLCILLGKGRKASAALLLIENDLEVAAAVAAVAGAVGEEEEQEEEGRNNEELVAEAEDARRRVAQVEAAVRASEREFEQHRVKLMAAIAQAGREVGGHGEAARALLAAVDVDGSCVPFLHAKVTKMVINTHRPVGLLAIVLALLSTTSYAARVLHDVAGETYQHTITFNKYLEDLPGAKLINPTIARSEVTVIFDVARITGPIINNITLIDYYGFVFRDPTSDEVATFGPTVRVKRGGTMIHNVVNNLITGVHNKVGTTAVQDAIGAQTEGNTFLGDLGVNLHTHGLYGTSGVFAQPDAPTELGPSTYKGGDNVFISIPPRPNAKTPPQSVAYNNPVASDHMPGMHWAHPHRHGAATVSVPTANMVFIVEDDPAFLPDANGCGPLRQILAKAQDRIMHLSITNFQLPDAINTIDNNVLGVTALTAASATDVTTLDAFLDAPNLQFASISSSNPLSTCCNGTYPKFPFKISADQDFLLLNGGYMPRIKLTSGVWQRWRFLHTAVKALVRLQILNSPTDLTPAPCRMALFSKDGVYMMELPRTIDAIFMGPANRVEVLVKCDAAPGSQFVLSSGYGPNVQGPLPDCPDTDPACSFFKGHIATIEVGKPDPGQASLPALVDEKCVPLRSDYVADMRDAAIAGTPAAKSIISQNLEMTDLAAFGCNINNGWYHFPTANPFTLTVGSINEIMMQFANHHSLHKHQEPYQLVSLTSDMLAPNTTWTNFYKEGDFQDSTYIPFLTDAYVPLRVNPSGGRFTGYALVHCHILGHEDTGCMIVSRNACPSTANSNQQPPTCQGVTSPVKGTFPASGITVNVRSTPPPPKTNAAAPKAAPVPAPSTTTITGASAPAPAPAAPKTPAPTPRSPPPPPRVLGKKL